MRTAIALAALAFVGFGCASSAALRRAEAEADSARASLEQLRAEAERLRGELTKSKAALDEATQQIQEDPDRSAQQQLKAKMHELSQMSEQLAIAKTKMDKDRAQIAQLEVAVGGLRNALAGNAQKDALNRVAVDYLEREGFKVGYLKARVTHEQKTYVVLDLDSAFGLDLMIVEEGGLLGWDKFGEPTAFWFKPMIQGIDILESYGRVKALSEARIYEEGLKARILRAAGK